jgi:hypothetical protein
MGEIDPPVDRSPQQIRTEITWRALLVGGGLSVFPVLRPGQSTIGVAAAALAFFAQ